MANGNNGGRGLSALLTVLAILILVVGTAVLIESYPSRGHQATSVTASAGTSSGSATSGATDRVAPIGGVATGGGGMAPADGSSRALPVFGGLAAFTAVAAAALMGWRHRMA